MIAEALLRALPQADLSTDQAQCADAGHDVFDALYPPAAIVRPRTIEELTAVARTCADEKAPMLAVGGGASYTLGYAPSRAGAVLIDTAGLDRIIAIDADNLTATVEAGVTWAALDAALAEKGLRAPFWGPYSGLRATLGGSLSQHAISMGSGLYETSANGVIALEIVDGRGRLVHTQRPAGAFLRSWGPDLTGMFLGDCGVFGLKARVVLKLMRRPTHAGACAFRFADFDAMAEAFRRVAGLMIASDMLGLDPEIQKGFLGALTPKGAMNAAKAIWAASPGPIAGARALLAAAAAPALSADAFAGQFTVEGWSSTEVKAKVQTIRQRIGGLGAETSNAGPLALRGDPFLPLAPVAPMSGGRWLPTHGLLPHSNAKAFHRAYEAWLGEEAETLRRHHIRLTRMFVPVGASAIVYEPTFYWPDALSPAQTRLAPRDYLAKVKKLDAAPDARAQVARLRRALTDLMRAHGAQHFQLGKWYTHLADRDPAAAEFLRAFKAAVDPHGLLNPGALDF